MVKTYMFYSGNGDDQWMKLSKKNKIILALIAGLIIIIVCILYPKSGTFDSLILKNYSRSEFTRIEILDNALFIDDKGKISKFLYYMGNLKLKECNKNLIKNKRCYDIYLYSNIKKGIGISIYNKNYISIYCPENYRDVKYYEVANKEINIIYIKQLLTHN